MNTILLSILYDADRGAKMFKRYLKSRHISKRILRRMQKLRNQNNVLTNIYNEATILKTTKHVLKHIVSCNIKSQNSIVVFENRNLYVRRKVYAGMIDVSN